MTKSELISMLQNVGDDDEVFVVDQNLREMSIKNITAGVWRDRQFGMAWDKNAIFIEVDQA